MLSARIVAAAGLIIVLAAAAVALEEAGVLKPIGESTTTSPSTTIVPLKTVTETGEGGATTNSGEAATSTGVTGMFTFNLSGKLPYVEQVNVEVNENGGQVGVVLELPTPCHNASLRYENGTIIVEVQSPPPKVMCVQVVTMKTAGIVIDQPLPPTLVLEVVKDGKIVGSVKLDLKG